ncbi:MAG: hypothetical protein QOK07_1553, partial [Gemmatimonadaceae bacterium]|nr:hypothetical protein [Gemmatimonadaceae bacterium]
SPVGEGAVAREVVALRVTSTCDRQKPPSEALAAAVEVVRVVVGAAAVEASAVRAPEISSSRATIS